MKKIQFDSIVAAYGARPDAWPEDVRDAALAFMQANSVVLADMTSANMVDSWLDDMPEPVTASEKFAEHLMEIPTRVSQIEAREIKRSWTFGIGSIRAWAPSRFAGVQMAGLAAACLMGIVLGQTDFARGVPGISLDASSFGMGLPAVEMDLKEAN